VSVDRDSAILIPDDVSDNIASLAALGAVSLLAVDTAGVTLGATVVVIGCGLVGQLVVRLLTRADAEVIAIDRHRRLLDLAMAGGAKATINTNVQGVRVEMKRLTGGDGASVVVDTTGSADALIDGLAIAGWGGRIVLVGGVHDPVTLNVFAEIQSKNLQLVSATNAIASSGADYLARSGTLGKVLRVGNSASLARATAFLKLIREGSVPVDGLVTHIVPWHHAAYAYELVSSRPRKGVGVALSWTDSA
jgi:threonine dehydrogenase-like Zn-dependent dehydrogenase